MIKADRRREEMFFGKTGGACVSFFSRPSISQGLRTMMTRPPLPLLLVALPLLSGCATPSLKEQQARGNMIIIARYDSRFPETGPSNGKIVTDNAGGVPSAVAGATGMSISASGGAALNVGVALLANLIFGAMAKDEIRMAFKVLYENTCEYGIRYLDLRKSPAAQELYPGHTARIENYNDGNLVLQPVTDRSGQQVYLTKSHACYAAWVAEWKEHQRVLTSKAVAWDTRRINYLFRTPPAIPEPEIPWVK